MVKRSRADNMTPRELASGHGAKQHLARRFRALSTSSRLAGESFRSASASTAPPMKENGPSRHSLSTSMRERREVVCAVYQTDDVHHTVGLAFVNVSIGEAVLTTLNDTQSFPKTIHKIQMLEATKILIPAAAHGSLASLDLQRSMEAELHHQVHVKQTSKTDWSEGDGMKYMEEVAFQDDIFSLGFLLKGSVHALRAFSAATKYIYEEFSFHFGKNSLRMKYQPPTDTMMINLSTVRSLELVENAYTTPHDSLLGILNQTITPMGSRLLKCNILQPPTQLSTIEPRFEAVSELKEDDGLCNEARKALQGLKGLGDVERLLTKLIILPKDGSVYESEQAVNNILKLKSFLSCLSDIRDSLSNVSSALLSGISGSFQTNAIEITKQLIDETIDQHACHASKPLELRNQKIHSIKRGLSAFLDMQRKLYEDYNSEVYAYALKLEDDLGIRVSLKYSTIRKFYLRTSSKDLASNRAAAVLINRTHTNSYTDCQTLKLVKFNERINQAVDGTMKECDKVVKSLLAKIRQVISGLFKSCESVALLDVLISFAQVASRYNYVRPEIQERQICLASARHPIIDTHGMGRCVPNDYRVADETRFQIITGINMSGKSTYIRCIAMIQVMAQIGCFVPADSAQMPLFHNLFARLSTDDALETTLSTFSVEMREMAFILRHVTEKSLVLVDELGRATSTRDGLAIATAVSEALLQCGATVFFATHFNELARCLAFRHGVLSRHLKTETSLPEMGSATVPILKMLYRIDDGPEMAECYGIDLARAVGFPASFIARAETVARELSAQAAGHAAGSEIRSEFHRQYKRRRLVTDFIRQLQLAEESGAQDEDLWRYFQEMYDFFWAKMAEDDIEGAAVESIDVD